MLLFTATDKFAIRIVELARKRLMGDLAVNSNKKIACLKYKIQEKIHSNHKTFTSNALRGFRDVHGSMDVS